MLNVPARRTCLLATLALLAAGSGTAARAGGSAGAIEAQLPGARLRGRGRLSFLGLPVYDIALWAEAPVGAGLEWQTQPLALEITYARRLEGRRIAERSLQEMRRQAAIAEDDATRWLAAMRGIFPDVQEGDRITGIHMPDGQTQGQARFLFNDRAAGVVADARFGRLFFGIWLSPQTSEPRLRESLLGTAGPGSSS